ncbi:hypothetical protein V6N12_036417 [Hibiscus sabdariffa]|uniref:Uncharacterized protein n=1 Tax=Hibiscus sabdariffa TaxID=183260 RepID=A0ABR2ER26_9ROSI
MLANPSNEGIVQKRRQVVVMHRANSIHAIHDSQSSNLELVRFFSGSLDVVDENVKFVCLRNYLGVIHC